MLRFTVHTVIRNLWGVKMHPIVPPEGYFIEENRSGEQKNLISRDGQNGRKRGVSRGNEGVLANAPLKDPLSNGTVNREKWKLKTVPVKP